MLLRDIFNIKGLALILKNISKCDVIHIMMLPIKTITSVLKVMTYSITSITACRVGLAVIWAITSASTFKTAVIIYILSTTNHPKFCINECYILCILISMMCNVITHIQESRIQRQTIAIEMLFFFHVPIYFFLIKLHFKQL